MKFIKSLICNCLCINNLHCINKIGVEKFKKDPPNKFSSFKKTKKLYLNNNVYFDIYQDDVSTLDIETLLNKSKNIEKNQLLTAEHIVPQSYIKSFDNAKFDMHNIYLTTSNINTHRSNYKYYDESKLFHAKDNNLLHYDPIINYKNNKLKMFIPIATSRGIIARSIAYMKIIYTELSIENIIDLDTLIKWNNQYPPSQLEKEKNILIYQIQGNYNEFILNPDLINIFF
tara:strand:- start:265 stop:951 length:687 start_codon:yes stop_codon:yes gene_type:complete